MAHIPMDDVKELYNANGHTWADLGKTVENRRGRNDGIGEYLIIDLAHALKEMDGESFPDSPEKLYEVLNKKLEGMPHETRAAREKFESGT